MMYDEIECDRSSEGGMCIASSLLQQVFCRGVGSSDGGGEGEYKCERGISLWE